MNNKYEEQAEQQVQEQAEQQEQEQAEQQEQEQAEQQEQEQAEQQEHDERQRAPIGGAWTDNPVSEVHVHLAVSKLFIHRCRSRN